MAALTHSDAAARRAHARSYFSAASTCESPVRPLELIHHWALTARHAYGWGVCRHVTHARDAPAHQPVPAPQAQRHQGVAEVVPVIDELCVVPPGRQGAECHRRDCGRQLQRMHPSISQQTCMSCRSMPRSQQVVQEWVCLRRAAATVALAVCACHLQQDDAWRRRTEEHEPEQRHGLQHRFQQHQRHARQPPQDLRPAIVLQIWASSLGTPRVPRQW